jgi:hypothetical protein
MRILALILVGGLCLENALAFAPSAFKVGFDRSGRVLKCPNLRSFTSISRRPIMQQAASAPTPSPKTRTEILGEIRPALSAVWEASTADACVKTLDG